MRASDGKSVIVDTINENGQELCISDEKGSRIVAAFFDPEDRLGELNAMSALFRFADENYVRIFNNLPKEVQHAILAQPDEDVTE